MADNVLGPTPKANIYKVGPAGDSGSIGGAKSDSGSQMAHLPSADSFKGGFNKRSNPSGASGSTTTSKRTNPVMPAGNPHASDMDKNG
jgi:hypothetical protein